MGIPKKVIERLTSKMKAFQSVLEQQKARDVSEADTVTGVKDILHAALGYHRNCLGFCFVFSPLSILVRTKRIRTLASCLGMAAFTLLCAGGCGALQASAPMSSSLVDMTFETQSNDGVWLNHRRVLSVNGLLPAPDVGIYYHYSNPTDPTTVICLSRDHSFRLVGVAGPNVTDEDVYNVRDKIVIIQAKTLEALTVSAAILRLELKDVEETPATAPLTPVDPTKQKEVTALLALRDKEKTLAEEIAAETEKLQLALRKPGMIVARWRGNRTSGFQASALPLFKGDTEEETSDSGYMILGGVRVSYLCFGDDYWRMLAKMPPTEGGENVLQRLSLVTFVLQARHNAYVADTGWRLAAETVLSANLKDLSAYSGTARAIAAAGNVKLRAYYTALLQLQNSGVVSTLTWTREPFCFIAGSDLSFISSPPNQGWCTLVSQSASSGSFQPNLKELACYALKASPYKCCCEYDQPCKYFPEIKPPVASRQPSVPAGAGGWH